MKWFKKSEPDAMTLKDNRIAALEAEKAGILRDKGVVDDERRKLGRLCGELRAEVDALRPDAERWRKRLANDRVSKARKRGSGSAVGNSNGATLNA